MSQADSIPADGGFNPCISCGICCTHFRISFYWAEADDAPGGFVPAHLTEKLTPHLRCMQGSNSLPRRCVGLSGTVGEAVACTIYANRPTPCREFPVYLEDGSANPRCDELRATIGLPPLPPFYPLPQAA
ncbi:YkgJ family cysteine cluster protein [Pseudothauera lacus]|uniref:YkgJ family cysteine cluster protein n=1 Tax=Pseudothauera lacus TaxID=2136175 RepID=A0A2T4IBV9_9RHOO|nr:YkgJ family cysteine cluster protein [Pseudothauera lacus]PTD95251.1 YkgJ family cysteine cluster protein [Pseudothauera lacus]